MSFYNSQQSNFNNRPNFYENSEFGEMPQYFFRQNFPNYDYGQTSTSSSSFIPSTSSLNPSTSSGFVSENSTNFNREASLQVNSNLTPTAQEFYPRLNNSGAIKKQTNFHSHKSRSKQNIRASNVNNHIDDSNRTFNFGQHSSNNESNFGANARNSNFNVRHRKGDRSYRSGKKQIPDDVMSEFAGSQESALKEDAVNDSKHDRGNCRNRYEQKRYQPKHAYKYDREGRHNSYDLGFNKSHYNTKQYSRSKNNDKLPLSRNNSENVKSKSVRGQSNKEKIFNKYQLQKKLDDASQRERLEEMINRRLLECLVCYERLKPSDKIWSCKQCYHIIHLSCVIEWAKTAALDRGWRCPACQNVCSEVPNQYRCYCGKILEPKMEPGLTPHSCGDVCLKKRRNCDHKCTILCHPGPCPECCVLVQRPCGCGATMQQVKCSSDIELVCEGVCDKILPCGQHKCLEKCHRGDCETCKEFLLQECFCGKVGRRVLCTSVQQGSSNYSCEEICEKTLSCGNHKCQMVCHSGKCGVCPRDISLNTTCPCGKTRLKQQRASCLEEIPCCEQICGKALKCGQPNSPHLCKSKCHEGECPPCALTTTVRCRCGHMDKEVPCQELTTKADDARCERKCTKKRLCGKHKCNQRCCIEIEHVCPLPCNHMLSCGNHRCERTCHSGRCPPCLETSFEELYCECGFSVLYPPVPCGTKPPICNKPCARERACGHDANHTCHTGSCPPCTILCARWCYGRHEQRKTIPCHQENFSCGLPCNRQMSCGKHKCDKPCHLGSCPLPCKQPCSVPRSLCGHPCNVPCHDSHCPDTQCRQKVPVTCICGVQKSTRLCVDVSEEFRNIEMAHLKEKMVNMATEQTVDLSDISNSVKKPTVLKILECTEECRVLERNRRLAIGLQIRNPDISQKLTPRYSDYLKNWAKKDPHFCQRIHDKLTELVQLAKQSKQKSRSHSFESMNREKRHFIHDYCEHFGCDSAAYDTEPNRNVVATALKDKSWLPSMSLLEVIQRENGQRKVPGPTVLGKSLNTKNESVSLKLSSGRNQRTATPPGEMVDHFD